MDRHDSINRGRRPLHDYYHRDGYQGQYVSNHRWLGRYADRYLFPRRYSLRHYYGNRYDYRHHPRYDRYCSFYFSYYPYRTYHYYTYDPWWFDPRYGLIYHTYPEQNYYTTIYENNVVEEAQPYAANAGDAENYYADSIQSAYGPEAWEGVDEESSIEESADVFYEEAVDPSVNSNVDPLASRDVVEPPSKELRDLVSEAQKAFKEGKYAQARDLYLRAVLADDSDGYVKFLLALSEFAMGDYDSATFSLRQALVTAPDLIASPIDVRRIYDEPSTFEAHLADLSKRVDEVAQLQAVAKVDQQRFLLGYLSFAGGNPRQALSVMNEYLKTDSDDDLAQAVLSVARHVLESPPRRETEPRP